MFSYLGELNEPPAFTAGLQLAYLASEPTDIIFGWVELTASGSRPTVPETLFCDEQRQIFLSAYLLRKRDGKCAILFQNENYGHGQGDMPGELWDCNSL